MTTTQEIATDSRSIQKNAVCDWNLQVTGGGDIPVAMAICGDYSGSRVDVPHATTLKLMRPQEAANLKSLENEYTYPGTTLSRHYFESPTNRPDCNAQAGFSIGIVLYCTVDVDPTHGVPASDSSTCSSDCL